MTKPKFKVGQRVYVADLKGTLVPAYITDISSTDGMPDYLCKPTAWPEHDLCGCKGNDCGGSGWVLEGDVHV